MSSSILDMALRFKTLGLKMAQASTDPLAALVSSAILDHLLAPQPVLPITVPSKVKLSLFEAPLLDKRKGKMLVEGPSK